MKTTSAILIGGVLGAVLAWSAAAEEATTRPVATGHDAGRLYLATDALRAYELRRNDDGELVLEEVWATALEGRALDLAVGADGVLVAVATAGGVLLHETLGGRLIGVAGGQATPRVLMAGDEVLAITYPGQPPFVMVSYRWDGRRARPSAPPAYLGGIVGDFVHVPALVDDEGVETRRELVLCLDPGARLVRVLDRRGKKRGVIDLESASRRPIQLASDLIPWHASEAGEPRWLVAEIGTGSKAYELGLPGEGEIRSWSLPAELSVRQLIAAPAGRGVVALGRKGYALIDPAGGEGEEVIRGLGFTPETAALSGDGRMAWLVEVRDRDRGLGALSGFEVESGSEAVATELEGATASRLLWAPPPPLAGER